LNYWSKHVKELHVHTFKHNINPKIQPCLQLPTLNHLQYTYTLQPQKFRLQTTFYWFVCNLYEKQITKFNVICSISLCNVNKQTIVLETCIYVVSNKPSYSLKIQVLEIVCTTPI
jgi:hypothetical protein